MVTHGKMILLHVSHLSCVFSN